MKNSIGVKIKTMRMSRHMTQLDLARELRVSRSAVGMWESDEREPNLDTIEALADIFNVPMAALIDKKEKTIEDNPQEMAELHFEMVADEDLVEMFPDFRKLNAAERKIIKDLAHNLAEQKKEA